MVAALGPHRCPTCALPERLCICTITPRIAATTRLVLLIHDHERRKPTNTGLLAARCLDGSEIHVVGDRLHPVDYRTLLPHGASNLVLFPTEDATPLNRDLCASMTKPIRLIALDGHWGQAARMRRKLPLDAPFTYVTLPSSAPTAYALRRNTRDRPGGLSTLEALARAYDILEGPIVSEPLRQIFRIFVDRSLWARGQLPAAAVFGGIPD